MRLSSCKFSDVSENRKSLLKDSKSALVCPGLISGFDIFLLGSLSSTFLHANCLFMWDLRSVLYRYDVGDFANMML